MFTIANAAVHDGTGAPPAGMEIHVRDGLIVEDGGGPIVDCAGLALAPGFIDTHTHDDAALLEGDLEAKISQGVTTCITGNCGVSLAPLVLDRPPPEPLSLLGGAEVYRFPAFASLFDEIEARGSPVNAACLAGHATLRVAAMSDLGRGANAGELGAMKALLREALDAGAIGLSTGLEYASARAASSDEVVELARLCEGAIYTTHMRDEGDGVLDAMEEAFATGRAANVPVVISHHKCSGLRNFGRSRETLALLDAVCGRQEIGLDVYPYDACSTILDRDFLAGARRTIVTGSRPHPEAAGRDLATIAHEWNCSPEEAADRLSPAGAVYFDMDEADVRRILSHRLAMIGSAGIPADAHPHPRLWGTFPRVLGHYARDVGLFPLEEAIRKMTFLPAGRFGLKRRGRIAPGYHADLVLFDPAAIRDTATFEQPKRAAEGIHTVWVNGVCVWKDGKPAGTRPGKILRRRRR